MTIDELRTMRNAVDAECQSEQLQLDRQFDLAIAEAQRVADIAENADKILSKLDAEFVKQTALDRTDWKFLLAAVVLQVLRQVVINKISSIDTDRELEKHNSEEIKTEERQAKDKFDAEHYKKGDRIIQGKYKTWKQILYETVPYDVTKHTKEALGTGLDGNTHRRRTFGHDPLLGWIFGTANIITDTISLSDFRTFRVRRVDPVTGAKGMGIVSGQIPFWTPFYESFESVCEDKMRLAAAIAAQGIHIASDRYTKKMLPIPGSTILPEVLCGKLYDSQWTEFTLAKKVKQIVPIGKFASEAAFAILINMIIGLIHGVIRDTKKYPDRELYEVKTRKILLYSNVIATSSNMIQVAIRSYFGDETAVKSLDLGGLVVTLYRVMVDTDFIRQAQDLYTFGGIEELLRKEMRHV